MYPWCGPYFARMVGVYDVCALFSCCVSKFSVALSNICANVSKAYPLRPVFFVGSLKIFWIAVAIDPAIFTALSIGVSLGIWICVGYSLYWADVLYPPVDGILKCMPR